MLPSVSALLESIWLNSNIKREGPIHTGRAGLFALNRRSQRLGRLNVSRGLKYSRCLNTLVGHPRLILNQPN